MIIHDPVAFEAWLTRTLEPMCDADPVALAKYVFALVKKEKPLPDLRVTMIKQLDVFLGSETQRFIELLFKTLETQDFSVPAPATPKSPSPAVPPPSELAKHGETPAPLQGDEVQTSQVQLPLAYQPVNGTVVSRRRDERSRSKHRKPDLDKDTDKGRRRHSSPRARSRSKSWDRSRRSRSRDRESRRDRDRGRAWRNKSPPLRRGYDRDRRRSWSNSPEASRNHTRSRSRSPRPSTFHRGRYRNRSPPGGGSRSRTRSPDHKEPISGGGTPTQDSNHGDVDMRLTTTSQSIQSVVGKADSTAPSLAPPPPTASFQGKGRCYDFDEKGYCMQGDLCQYDHGVDPVVLEDVALSNMLTFGPTPPPPPPPGTGLGPLPPPPVGNPPPPGPAGEPPRPRPPPLAFQQHRVIQTPGSMEYNPDAPAMEPRGMTWVPRPGYRGGMGGHARGGSRGPRPVHYHMPAQRELIPVPVQGEEPYQPGYGRGSYGGEKDMGMKKRVFDFNRLGPRHKQPPQNCSLELKKVPRGLNNITHLNNHFAKFGKIVNIQVNYDNDPEAALVTFSSHAEANAAYRSTEAVLNNRFIKVFWHTSPANNNNNNNNNAIEPSKHVQENVPPMRQSVKERLGMPSLVNHVTGNTLQPKIDQELVDKVMIAGGTITKTLYIPTALKKMTPTSPPTPVAPTPPVIKENKANTAAAVKRSQDLLEARVRIRRLQQNKQKDSLKLSMNLRKRKQVLMDNHIKQMTLLVGRAEKAQDEEKKNALMVTIRRIQVTIDTLRKELRGAIAVAVNTRVGRVPTNNRLKINVPPLATSTPVPVAAVKTKEQAQREILDAELDLYARQQEGGDTTELQRKVNELKVESSRLLGFGPSPRGRGRGSMRGIFRGRGRASYSTAHSSVDHRPTRVLVSGYENDEKVDVITHFRQFGEIVDFMCDDATPSVIFNYKSRKEAESAMLKGKNFQDRVLSVTWCTQQSTRGHVMSSVLMRHRSMSLASGTEEGQLLGEEVEDEEEAGLADYNEDLLLQDDEEEEDEDEEKSWRR